MNVIQNFRTWLGEGRFWALIGMLVVTGLGSFVAQIVGIDNAVVSQNALLAAFLLGTIFIVGSRMDVEQRGRWSAILVPSFGLVLLGVLFLPQYLLIFLGAAFGWALISLLLFGDERTPMQYRQAIKAMRNNDYKTAVDTMDGLIKEESDDPNHYRFRAELLRLWGKLGRARRDYQMMIEKSTNDADLAVAYNGMAEVDLQAGNYQDALVAAHKAYELAPDEWVAAYNLGMIADRLGDSTLTLDSLEKALAATIPDSRHRLLVYLWQLRAYMRQDQQDLAKNALKLLKSERNGLKEWQKILPEEQAKVLREVLEADITLAEQLIDDKVDLSALGVA
ncbi:MAG: tetratricopeptide repeat protein [Phototrophicaceae bacterium]